jgi:hypothetical protein
MSSSPRYMRSRTIRILTAIAVIAGFGWTAAYGLEVVCFSRARAAVASAEDRARVIQPWIDTPGLAEAALEASLAGTPDPNDIDGIRKRGAQFVAIVSLRPMSSINWLMLASMRSAAGQSLDRVLAALQLSSLTGANEAQVALQRGIFGLWQWENLPSQVRRQTVSGLVAALLQSTISDKERMTINGILAAKSAASRREIAASLRAEGLPASDLRHIGL